MPNAYQGGASAKAMLSAAAGSDGGSGDPQFDVPDMPVKTVLARLSHYVKPYAALALASFACSVISVVAQLIVPILIGQAIDTMVSAGTVDFAALQPILIRLACTIAVAAAANWAGGYGTNRLAYQTVRDLRIDA